MFRNVLLLAVWKGFTITVATYILVNAAAGCLENHEQIRASLDCTATSSFDVAGEVSHYFWNPYIDIHWPHVQRNRIILVLLDCTALATCKHNFCSLSQKNSFKKPWPFATAFCFFTGHLLSFFSAFAEHLQQLVLLRFSLLRSQID